MTNAAEAPTALHHAQEFIESLTPRIPDIAASMGQDRQLPQWLAEEMRAAGLFKLLVPGEFGGLEMDPVSAAGIIESLSRLDGSLGWLAMIGSQSSWLPCRLDREIYGEIVSNPGAALAGALKPGGKAVPVEGGYRVSGRWPFASGCTHATWLYGTCMVQDPDNPPPEGGMPEIRVVFAPASQAQVIDTWDTPGLQGTGSHDIAIEDLFVPSRYTYGFVPLDEPRYTRGPLYRDGYVNLVFVLQGAQAVGMAEAAFDAFTQLAPQKMRWASMQQLSKEPAVRADVARAWTSLQAARAFLYTAAGEAWATILRGDPPGTDQRMNVRLAITHAITTAVHAGSVFGSAAGSGVVYNNDRLGRIVRDLEVAAAHVQAAPGIWETGGGYLLGEESEFNPNVV